MVGNSNYRSNERMYTSQEQAYKATAAIFENLPELIDLELASKVLNREVSTFYDWKYRGETRKSKIPSDLFLKIGGGLYIKKNILVKWILN